jgi:sporulation protein YlmC with PRC-barrel domain
MGRAIAYERQLRNRSVVGSGGRVLGEVHDIVFDPDSGHVMMLIVRLRAGVAGSIGMREAFFRRGHVDVPWEFVQGISETVVLRTTVTELGEHLQSARREGPSTHA